MQKTKLAILGASYLQLPLVKKAKDLGVETHCFAWKDGAVCKEICDYFYPVSVLDKDYILAKCTKIKIDGITTIATDIAVPTISYVAQHLGLISNSEKSAEISTNKGAMRSQFELHGLSSPKYLVVEKYKAGMGKDLKFPVIVKPVDRSGSRGVNKVENDAELEKSIEIALEESINKRVIVEEFIEGDEVSVETISWEGKHHLLAITDKVTTGSPNFVELAHHQPSLLPQDLKKRIESLTKKALDSLGVRYGAGHTEIKINGNGHLSLIEVGARMGGDFIGSHLVELSTGYDFLKGVIDIALNRFSLPYQKLERSAGVYFLSKETEDLMPYFFTKNSFDKQKEITDKDLKVVKSSNDRAGYLIYQADKKPNIL